MRLGEACVTYLQNYQVLSSRDLYETRALLAELNSIDTLDLIERHASFDVSIHGVALGDLQVLHSSFGDCRIQLRTPESDNDALFMIIPTEGGGSVQHQGQNYTISTKRGMIRDMRVPLFADEDRFACLGVRLPKDIIARHCRTLLGNDMPTMDPGFEISLDLDTAPGRHVCNTLNYIAQALDDPLHNLDNSIVLNSLQDLLLTNILMMFPNSCSEQLNGKPKSNAVPHYVKRARDYIHAYAHTAITHETLVQHAGCGYRTLQMAFNAAYGMSPMAYLRSVRLNNAYNDLLNDADGAGVAEIAMKWGFAHAGRFARIYARQFGVLPSETLRKRQ